MDHLVTVSANVALPTEANPGAISSLVRHVLGSQGVAEAWQVGIRFVDDATMQAAHNDFMGIDEPTDIMTFPYADDDDIWGDTEAGGDLMISVDTARENATSAGWPLADELFFLIAHGLLHLLGRNDATENDRAAMLEYQHTLIRTWVDRP